VLVQNGKPQILSSGGDSCKDSDRLHQIHYDIYARQEILVLKMGPPGGHMTTVSHLLFVCSWS